MLKCFVGRCHLRDESTLEPVCLLVYTRTQTTFIYPQLFSLFSPSVNLKDVQELSQLLISKVCLDSQPAPTAFIDLKKKKGLRRPSWRPGSH